MNDAESFASQWDHRDLNPKLQFGLAFLIPWNAQVGTSTAQSAHESINAGRLILLKVLKCPKAALL